MPLPPWPKEKLTLDAPVWDQACVYLDRIPFRDRSGRDRVVTVVDLDWSGVMVAAVTKLRGSVVCDANGEPRVLDHDMARFLGRLLYAELHRDIGSGDELGKYASLGRIKINWRKFRRWQAVEDGSRADQRFETYQHARPPSLSYRAWKALFNFPFPEKLPSAQALETADGFLARCGIELASQEARLQWGRPRKGPWPRTMDGLVPRSIYKNMRIRQRTLLKQAGHESGDEVDHAATLISLADAVELFDRCPRDILRAIPEGTLNGLDRRVFELMWLAEPGRDERGRFDIPLVSSPGPWSLLDLWLGEHERNGAQRGHVCELLDFLETGSYNAGIREAERYAWLYAPWLAWVRAEDLKRHRPSNLPLKET